MRFREDYPTGRWYVDVDWSRDKHDHLECPRCGATVYVCMVSPMTFGAILANDNPLDRLDDFTRGMDEHRCGVPPAIVRVVDSRA